MGKLEELRQKNQDALMAGGKENIEAQKKAGKGTARERISGLLDESSFIEIDKFVKRTYGTPGFEAVSETGEGVVCGYGTMEGRPVFIFAQDYTVLKGSLSVAHAAKILKTLDMAAKNGVPVIGMLDSDGARIAEGIAAIDSYAAILEKLNAISGVVPTVCIVAGNCIGTAAYIAATADVTFMIEGVSALSLHGPQVYASTLDKTPDFGAKKHGEKTGVAQFVCAGEAECFASVRKWLGFLPSNSMDDIPFMVCNDDLNRMLPTEYTDTRELVKVMADNGDVMEYQAEYSPELITMIGRINGMTTGFVANAKDQDMTGHAARKAAKFISLLDAYSIPVVTLVDCGQTPVTQQNNMYISNIARMIGIYANASVPKITVVVGRAVADGFAMMCPKSLGADIVYAWPQAQITAMPPEAGAVILYEKEIAQASDAIAAKQQMIQKYLDEYANPWQAAAQGVVDDVIDPAMTRQMVAAAIEMFSSKRVESMPKKHRIASL